jgi:hypothetical protein
MKADALLLLVAARKAHALTHPATTHSTRPADIAHLLEPPPHIGYGYATRADLRALGFDPAADRELQIRTWVADLKSAVEIGLITAQQMYDAMDRSERADQRWARRPDVRI